MICSQHVGCPKRLQDYLPAPRVRKAAYFAMVDDKYQRESQDLGFHVNTDVARNSQQPACLCCGKHRRSLCRRRREDATGHQPGFLMRDCHTLMRQDMAHETVSRSFKMPQLARSCGRTALCASFCLIEGQLFLPPWPGSHRSW